MADIKHTTQSAVADEAVAGEIGPSEWNAAHTIEDKAILNEHLAPETRNKLWVAGILCLALLLVPELIRKVV